MWIITHCLTALWVAGGEFTSHVEGWVFKWQLQPVPIHYNLLGQFKLTKPCNRPQSNKNCDKLCTFDPSLTFTWYISLQKSETWIKWACLSFMAPWSRDVNVTVMGPQRRPYKDKCPYCVTHWSLHLQIHVQASLILTKQKIHSRDHLSIYFFGNIFNINTLAILMEQCYSSFG